MRARQQKATVTRNVAILSTLNTVGEGQRRGRGRGQDEPPLLERAPAKRKFRRRSRNKCMLMCLRARDQRYSLPIPMVIWLDLATR